MTITLTELLEHLDGNGIVFTDRDIAKRALAELDLKPETRLPVHVGHSNLGERNRRILGVYRERDSDDDYEFVAAFDCEAIEAFISQAETPEQFAENIADAIRISGSDARVQPFQALDNVVDILTGK